MSSAGEIIDALSIARTLIETLLADKDVRAITDKDVVDDISMTDKLECFLREPAVLQLK